MALNWVMLTQDRTPIPFNNENILTEINAGVELSLSIPDTPPSDSALAGGSGGSKTLKSTGKIYLTDQRLIFINGREEEPLDSSSIPLYCILSTNFEQPIFGSNYLSIEIKPSPQGGLTEGTKAMIRFKDKPMFEFISLLEKSRERAIYMRKEQYTEPDLPTYTARAESSSTVEDVPAENPPEYRS